MVTENPTPIKEIISVMNDQYDIDEIDITREYRDRFFTNYDGSVEIRAPSTGEVVSLRNEDFDDTYMTFIMW
eukprot:CAMPEP_0204643544 /NCGR_PEP_ID=MMETSP0718-20130828/793_1 /ASSEMBLY_ACC=CAM_ASM_000674 /TAXON_ID=230516 /ORGANISM="Chaetoceros curvisetus" /LENGTH=71 /DNA_ID=CAMNT_0051664799 /DNA_START=89 /DNA_END=301 /DNA_ORIENTATION=+